MKNLTVIPAVLLLSLPLTGCGLCDHGICGFFRGDPCGDTCSTFAPACCPDPCGDPCGPSVGDGCSSCAPGGTFLDGGTTPIPRTLPETYIAPETRPGPGGA